jgi:myo-inositol 2-dehydrogenase / D-chiro-inositol 1-dehydrogenase
MATRREVVAGAAGILLLRPETVFGYQANSAVSFGIIGTGARGKYVGGLMAKDAHARLAAICDLYPDKIAEAQKTVPGAGAVKTFTDYRQLLAEKELDAVYIATPVYLHPEHFEAAVQSNKHVYCEKPAGADVAGVKRTLAAGQKAPANKRIQFGFQQRFSPEYLAARALVEAGDLGEPKILVSSWLLGMAPSLNPPATMPGARFPEAERRNRNWLRWRGLSGGDIVECDCHGLDTLNWFANGHPTKAVGQGGLRYPIFYGDVTSDHYNIIFSYPGGADGWLLSARSTAGFRDVKEQFYGSKGMLETARTYYKLHGPVAAARLTNDDILEDTSMVRRVASKREITIDAVEAFFKGVAESKPINMTATATESTFTSILGRMAFEGKREATWDEMMKAG